MSRQTQEFWFELKWWLTHEGVLILVSNSVAIGMLISYLIAFHNGKFDPRPDNDKFNQRLDKNLIYSGVK